MLLSIDSHNGLKQQQQQFYFFTSTQVHLTIQTQ